MRAINHPPIYIHLGSDLYEVFFTGEVVRYRHGKDGRGESIDFELLPAFEQEEIYRTVRLALQRREHEDSK